MSDEMIIASYKAARDEVIARVGIRTRVLGFYLVGSGAIIAYAQTSGECRTFDALLGMAGIFNLANSGTP